MEDNKYDITTIEQILNVVNDKNIDVLLNDFAKYLVVYKGAINAVREAKPLETKNKRNSEIFQSSFLWIDDGVSELTGLMITEKETGKQKYTKF